MYGETFTEGHYPLDVIPAATYSAEENSEWVDVSKYERVVILIDAATVATTLDADVEIATDSGGSNIHTLKSMTQLEAGDDGSLVAIEVRAEELSKPSGADSTEYRYLRLETTPDGNCVYSAWIIGFLPRFAPVGASAWTEVVS